MSKKNFVTLILSAIGGILYALGMCMTLLPEWNAWGPGVVTGCTGMVVLLVMLLIRRKMAGKPVLVKLTAKTVAVTVLGMAGTLTLGAGMCMVMVWDMLVYGIVIGLVGIVLLMCLIPLVKGLQ